MKIWILCSAHNPKILRLDDEKIIGDRIAEFLPVSGDIFPQEFERCVGKFPACGVGFVVRQMLVHDAPEPRNPGVKISRKRNKDAWITVTPFDPQPDPPNLTAIKAETLATWPMTSLLDGSDGVDAPRRHRCAKMEC